MTSSSGKPDPEQRGYPIGALFVLVTLAAVLTVAATPQIRELSRGGASAAEAAGAVSAGAIVGLILGAVLGVLSHRWGRGLLIGAGMGLLLGMVAGLIGTTPMRHFPRMAIAMLVGSLLIVLLAYVMRRKE